MGRAHALYTARDSLSLFLISRPYLSVLGGFIVMISILSKVINDLCFPPGNKLRIYRLAYISAWAIFIFPRYRIVGKN